MTRKVGDIIEFDIKMEIMASEDELSSKSIIDTSDYNREYSVSYCVNDSEETANYTLEADAGTTPTEDDVKMYIEEEMKNSFNEVTEYEIFDLDNDYMHQCAKVRIKSVKN
ncbi:MAG: hypothetical protein ACI37Q_00715 [Candidatus Gastranaerophilaceae bacterium]